MGCEVEATEAPECRGSYVAAVGMATEEFTACTPPKGEAVVETLVSVSVENIFTHY